MPLIAHPEYRPPAWQRGGHLQTIIPNALRHVPLVTRQRERLELNDGDFLDLGWAGRDGSRLAILSHALDNRYTAPLHGFRDAAEYWASASSTKSLGNIQIPTLVLNARNDPFLSASCNPIVEAAASAHVFLDCPEQGGHVGFALPGTLRET